MWKTIHQSVQGSSHQRTGAPCQDSCAAVEVRLDGETVLVLACSDGAGSAEFSAIGSRLACDTLVELVAAELRLGPKLPTVSAECAGEWLRVVHRTLNAEADALEVDARQLACTLLFAVLGESGAAFGQVGDGAIVARQDAAYQRVFWPQSGEYINTTNFITQQHFERVFEFAWRDHAVDEVALFTDGLQMLGLDFQKRQAHGPFFAPLFEALRKQPRSEDLTEPLRAFLDSPEVIERTDDDKTLVLATRIAG